MKNKKQLGINSGFTTENKGNLELLTKSISIIFYVFTAIAFHSTSVINITALGTFPVLWAWNKITGWMWLATFFTCLTPIIIRERTFSTKPIMAAVRVLTIFLSRSWSRIGTTGLITISVIMITAVVYWCLSRGNSMNHYWLKHRQLWFYNTWNSLNNVWWR